MSNPAFGNQIPGSLVMAQGGDRPDLYELSPRKAIIDAALANDKYAEVLRKEQLARSTESTLARRPELQSEISDVGSALLHTTVSLEITE